jgi:hypothetical protein
MANHLYYGNNLDILREPIQETSPKGCLGKNLIAREH